MNRSLSFNLQKSQSSQTSQKAHGMASFWLTGSLTRLTPRSSGRPTGDPGRDGNPHRRSESNLHKSNRMAETTWRRTGRLPPQRPGSVGTKGRRADPLIPSLLVAVRLCGDFTTLRGQSRSPGRFLHGQVAN